MYFFCVCGNKFAAESEELNIFWGPSIVFCFHLQKPNLCFLYICTRREPTSPVLVNTPFWNIKKNFPFSIIGGGGRRKTWDSIVAMATEGLFLPDNEERSWYCNEVKMPGGTTHRSVGMGPSNRAHALLRTSSTVCKAPPTYPQLLAPTLIAATVLLAHSDTHTGLHTIPGTYRVWSGLEAFSHRLFPPPE